MTTSTSVSQMASGISLVSFNSRPDGMHQRSYSVSSADQWSEATVIANSGISSGKKLGAGGGDLHWGEKGIWCSVVKVKIRPDVIHPDILLEAKLPASEGKRRHRMKEQINTMFSQWEELMYDTTA